ncbi:MAG TPA: glycosyltransferase [Methanoculleus sp.]|nr:glycosyltransferase [Methanoculleus sp.]
MTGTAGIDVICGNGRRLEDHRTIVGDTIIEEIYAKAARLGGKKMVHINSTSQGGGVAEMLHSLIPLMNDAGIAADWKVLHGCDDFFAITKQFHNALQSEHVDLPSESIDHYLETNKQFSSRLSIDHDFVVVHDPQPLPLIQFFEKSQPWIWRCHVDLSTPDMSVWQILEAFVTRYDHMIISHPAYRRETLIMDQMIFHPAIDPLSEKNRDLPAEVIADTLASFGIATDKPLITQISRFDKWKDPEGVIDIFLRVRREVDCRLVLCGSMAPDDPEGWEIYQRVVDRAGDLVTTGDVILITCENSTLVNVLQRVSDVIIQKSLREGFGLTVTEALWKERPVVASRAGGIPLQITDGETGFLVDPRDTAGFAERALQILRDPELGRQLGRNAKEHVREHFLITRLVAEYLDLMMRENGNGQDKRRL